VEEHNGQALAAEVEMMQAQTCWAALDEAVNDRGRGEALVMLHSVILAHHRVERPGSRLAFTRC
jgi:hypothetical protein